MKKLSVPLALAAGFLVIASAATDAGPDRGRLRAVSLDIIPACRVPLGVTSYSDEKPIPAALREALKQKIGDLVLPGAAFDSTDWVTTGHSRRLIFIWARGNRWIVATEHGGRAYNDPIFAYEISPNGQRANLIGERIAGPKFVCATAEELLNKRPGSTAAANR